MNGEPIGIGMIGLGTVGGGVATLLATQAKRYQQRLGREVVLRRVVVRDVARARGKKLVDPAIITDNLQVMLDDPSVHIVVELAGGVSPVGDFVKRAIASGRHVVTANKSLLAKQGPELFALARKHNVSIAFEASCGGGIPMITALQFGLMANDIQKVVGILNGTCNYILTAMTREGRSYQDALTEAKAKGYAEADETLDVSGQDAAQKLVIIAGLAFGVNVPAEEVWCVGIDELDLDDIRFGAELGYDIKLLAIGERVDHQTVSLRVHPCFVHEDSQIAQVSSSFNALSVYGHAVGHTMFYGRGAGEMPTASAVVSDLLNVAGGWYPVAYANMNLWSPPAEPAKLQPPDDWVGRFYIRLAARDVPGVMAAISKALGDAGISLSALRQHESDVGQFVPVVITTHDARQGAVASALRTIEKLDVIQGKPVCIRIVDMPEG